MKSAMLLVKVKAVVIGDKIIKLYSLDGGRLWFSRPSDYRFFKLRQREEKKSVRKMISAWVADSLG